MFVFARVFFSPNVHLDASMTTFEEKGKITNQKLFEKEMSSSLTENMNQVEAKKEEDVGIMGDVDSEGRRVSFWSFVSFVCVASISLSTTTD